MAGHKGGTRRDRGTAHRARLRALRAVVETFADPSADVTTAEGIYESVRGRVSIMDVAGVTEAEIIRQWEQEWLRKLMGASREPISGHNARSFQYDGSRWYHLAYELWRLTRDANAPDAKIRREELLDMLAAIVRYRRPFRDSNDAVMKGMRRLAAEVKAGKTFEQPELLDDAGNE